MKLIIKRKHLINLKSHVCFEAEKIINKVLKEFKGENIEFTHDQILYIHALINIEVYKVYKYTISLDHFLAKVLLFTREFHIYSILDFLFKENEIESVQGFIKLMNDPTINLNNKLLSDKDLSD